MQQPKRSCLSHRAAKSTPRSDDDAGDLKATLQRVYGRSDVTLAKGWSSEPALKLTHVGRGFEGYTGEENSLQPSEEGRPSQTAFLAPRRLAPQPLTSLRAFLRRATYTNRR